MSSANEAHDNVYLFGKSFMYNINIISIVAKLNGLLVYFNPTAISNIVCALSSQCIH